MFYRKIIIKIGHYDQNWLYEFVNEKTGKKRVKTFLKTIETKIPGKNWEFCFFLETPLYKLNFLLGS